MVIIRNALALAGKVRIRFSPVMELSLALSVLEAPDHHPDQEAWAEAWEREAGTPVIPSQRTGARHVGKPEGGLRVGS